MKLQSTHYKRNVYLDNIKLSEVHKLLKEKYQNKGHATVEIVTVEECIGRRTAKALYAIVSAPYYNGAAMDGICVKYDNVKGVNEKHGIILTRGTDYEEVDTGDPIKEGYDAVIMIEDVEEISFDQVIIKEPVSPWQHVRPAGEDIVVGELILASDELITPVALGALVAGGYRQIPVYKIPTVAILSTGTEIIKDPDELIKGKILDSNSYMLTGLVKQYGGNPICYPPMKDNRGLLRDEVAKLTRDHDIVILGAGSSAGREDYTKSIIEELGEVYVHGICIKPGKPAIIGEIDEKPVIGIPGYPVAAYMVMEQLVKPLISFYGTQTKKTDNWMTAYLSNTLNSTLKYEEYVRVKIGKVSGRYVAMPLKKGSGITMSLVKADGLVKIGQESEGIPAGSEVRVKLLKDLERIDNTLVITGSHDILLDILNELLHQSDNKISISSTHMGSMGGILAMKRRECHIAPIHLVDEETGVYNETYKRRFFEDDQVTLVKGVKRIQGLYVKAGNPKGIKCIGDLVREDIVMVNRQKGAGTRVLLDILLKRAGIDWNRINGYNRVMSTHTMVANAVLTETADVGVGIYAVAKAMDLDFIPIGEEEYDFLVDNKIIETDMFKSFLQVLQSEAFKTRLVELGGYATNK